MADRRNFRQEIAAAVKSNDVGELMALAYQLLGRVEADDDRRERAAEKKRKERERKGSSQDVPRQAGTSRTSQTANLSQDVPGRPGTSGDVAAVVPPLRSLTTHPPLASSEISRVLAELGNSTLDQLVAQLRAWYSDEQWEDIAAFFMRRRADRWYEWVKAMLRDCGGTGSQFTRDDLLRVCQDDGTLDKRIGSAGVLRKFLAPARAERMGPGERSPPSTERRSEPKSNLNVANRAKESDYPEASKTVKWQTTQQKKPA